jgi:hypothetical protein
MIRPTRPPLPKLAGRARAAVERYETTMKQGDRNHPTGDDTVR